jgi:DNA-binding NtrC family response regulator
LARTERLTTGEAGEESPAPIVSWLVRIGVAATPLLAPEIFPLSGRDRFSIGRNHQRDLEDLDPWLSGDHAEIAASEGGYELRDLGSSNGSYYWGERRSAAPLADGDVFDTGGTFWMFRAMAVTGALPAPPFEGPLATLYPPLAETVERLRRVARTRVPMMLLGSTGTGKEVFARAIHDRSGRSGPFLAINTAAIQRTLVASELFGVEQGAHSMAERSRQGQIRAAEGGTLLLDEIGDMPSEVQAALLRAIQESEVIPVGGDRPVKVDVRFLCATHRDLEEMVTAGTFRADLFARLSGVRLQIPDLADRAEDIGLIIGRLLERWHQPRISFTPAAYRALLVYPWPLNVRELEKALESAIALAGSDRIDAKSLPDEIQRYRPEVAKARTAEASDDLEQTYQREIARLMQVHRGNVSAVARSMGRSRMQIHRWLKRLELDPESFRRG